MESFTDGEEKVYFAYPALFNSSQALQWRLLQISTFTLPSFSSTELLRVLEPTFLDFA
jgi:hypothetical protein